MPGGDGPHRVRWCDGRLVLLHHPDPIGEQVLVALGGERCLCFDVLDAWRAQVRLLELPRPGGRLDELDGARRRFDQRHARIPVPDHQRAATARRLERRWLEQVAAAFPPALRARLERAHLVAGGRRVAPGPGALDARYDDLLDPFVLEACHAALAAAGTAVPADRFAVACWTPARGQRPDVAGVVGPRGGFAAAVLPRGWVTDVAARGIAAVDDGVVVEVLGAARRDVIDVRACRWRPAPGLGLVPEVAPARVTRAGGAWALRWTTPDR